MREAVKFVGNTPVAAHNASFDKKFWESELAYLSALLARIQKVSCAKISTVLKGLA
jgi:DNA polymerase-3 subunit epsilon